ncbi:hypothetical protein QU862_22070, partial [Escherichia coli]|nr:hypothetical protein [Escherichia coli]
LTARQLPLSRGSTPPDVPDHRYPAPLEALAGRLQGCLYRADMLQQECEALLVDFPEQEKELRELSAWMAGAVR